MATRVSRVHTLAADALESPATAEPAKKAQPICCLGGAVKIVEAAAFLHFDVDGGVSANP